jgi:hypothetical protein
MLSPLRKLHRETELVEPGNATVPDRLRLAIPQELNLNMRYGVGKRRSDVLSLDVGTAHVSGELPA